MLTETDVTYKWIDVLTRILHCHVHHKLRNQWRIQDYEREFQPFKKTPAQFELKNKEYLNLTALLESLNPTALLEYLNYQDWNLFKRGFHGDLETHLDLPLGMDYCPSTSLHHHKQTWNPWRNIDHKQLLQCHELMAITYYSGVHCNQTKIFELLLGKIKWYPGFNHWFLPSPRTRHVKKLQIFSQLFTQCFTLKNL